MERELPLVCRMTFQIEASKMELHEPMFAIMIIMTWGGFGIPSTAKRGDLV
jgi:hypothetical protein